MYVTRTVEQTIRDASRSFPCIVLYGPRQVGKSTTIDVLFGDRYRKVTLDDLDDRTLAESNPRLFLETYSWPLIIDEIQKVPTLLDEIKKIIDRQRLQWMRDGHPQELMYILTGSNRFELQQGISDSLAGRCGVIDMASFSQPEKHGTPARLFTTDIATLLNRERDASAPYRTRKEVFDDIFQGGMPDICTGVSERELYFRSYVSTYIERDVRKLIAASSEMQFRNFIALVALRTAQELHYDALANDAGIDARTCRKWISILETSGIIYLLQPYLPNASKRIIKAPKMYFMDTGLCAYLCRWPDARMLEDGAMGGAFFETYVVSEMVKNAYGFNRDPRDFLYYYRDVDRKEIDLVYAERDGICPIEVKKGVAASNPTRNFHALDKYHRNVNPGLVIDTCDKIRPINDLAYAYPVYLLGA